MAPIDPLQLLNALGNLLSGTGGIRSIENVQKISSLMKKFSKKLVSRCVYCHVLKATSTEVLNVFLDQDGWLTLNLWLSEAKESDNIPFLIDMMQLFRVLPMNLDRLKQNNTAKVAKSLCKSPNETVKKLAIEVVTRWMKLIKGETAAATEKPVEKAKKKKKKDKTVKEVKQQKVITGNSPKNNVQEKEVKEHINNKIEDSVTDEIKKSDDDDDDDDDYDEKEVEIAKVKEPRPKTVKRFQTKFRSTGLIEETPLPKLVIKKPAVVDRTAVAAAAKNAIKRNSTPLPSYPEKKIKPSSLITPADQANSGPGIKLIPPKPKPVHILHESAGFMDALVSAPVPIVRKRKKSVGKGGIPTSPTTPPPTQTPPKLQFYKDTLEMNESESAENSQGSEESQKKDSKDGDEEVMDADVEEKSNKDSDEKMDTTEDNDEGDSVTEGGTQLRSILCHVKRRDKKKTVKWAEESTLKEFFYFDLDETERVNVNNMKNFGDMKSLEMKRERENFETSKRLMLGDKMSEGTMWSRLQLIDLPPPIVVPGSNSTENELQSVRQQTTLQEIYFSRQMIPDTPQEPDPEQHNPQDPQVIPLEDLSNPGQVVDYSTMDLPSPKATLPNVLTNLMMSITGQHGFQSPVEDMQQDMMQAPPNEIQMPMEIPTMNILGPIPDQFIPNQEQYLGPPPNMEGTWQEWRGPESEGGPPPMMEGFYPQDGMTGMPIGLPPNMQPPTMGGNPRGGPRNHHMGIRHGLDMRLHGRMQHNMRGHMMGMPRNRSPRQVVCNHFMTGTCRFGPNCKFLHPGVNGPML